MARASAAEQGVSIAMNRQHTSQQVLLTRGRVAASALEQAARHEQAVLACLSELEGTDLPAPGLVRAIRRRAERHLERAGGLTRTAMRLDPDAASSVIIAGRLEQHERLALQVARRLDLATVPHVAVAS
jgi:hypothetical protein